MLIEAARPLLDTGRMELHLVGDGPLMPALKAQAQCLGGVHFHGWLKHEAMQDVAARCHILAFPSIREFGGGAVLFNRASAPVDARPWLNAAGAAALAQSGVESGRLAAGGYLVVRTAK